MKNVITPEQLVLFLRLKKEEGFFGKITLQIEEGDIGCITEVQQTIKSLAFLEKQEPILKVV